MTTQTQTPNPNPQFKPKHTRINYTATIQFNADAEIPKDSLDESKAEGLVKAMRYVGEIERQLISKDWHNVVVQIKDVVDMGNHWLVGYEISAYRQESIGLYKPETIPQVVIRK